MIMSFLFFIIRCLYINVKKWYNAIKEEKIAEGKVLYERDDSFKF